MASKQVGGDPFEDGEDPIVALTPEQVLAVKAATPVLSPWRVVLAQALLGLGLMALAWLIWDVQVATSVASGSLAVVLPGALFARGVTSRFARANAGSAVMSFFLWEFVKVMVSVAVMFAAYKWIVGLNWLAMIGGLVLTLKVYWLALAFKPKVGSVRD
jgi:ATP synthase protein I